MSKQKAPRRLQRTIRVDDVTKDERAALQLALSDVEVRAFVIVVGLLIPLPSGGRRRVLEWSLDAIQERTAATRRTMAERAGIVEG
jgi:hypothetical protein